MMKSTSRPGNSSHANAYAASAATKIGSTVAPIAICAVTHSECVIGPLWKMSL